MAWSPISGDVPQWSTPDNELGSGYWLKFYASGTTTPISMATSSSGGTTLAKAKLNDRGCPISNELDNDTVFIPHLDQNYRIVLFKTEAAADANDTSDVLFNVDGVATTADVNNDAAFLTLRNTTIEAQDDYDRSPLFVDGTDFTAGAGPHVITVPSGWNPNDSGFRFYKVNAAGTVTGITPTGTTGTTFTVGEALAASDVVFIGDDSFRNQMDGDPSDIRERLSLVKTTSSTDTTAGRVWRTDDLVKTTSSTDTTSGSMLQVGAGHPQLDSAVTATSAETRTGAATDKFVTPLAINETQIGWGQSWTTTTKTGGTNYTNTHDAPIMVAVTLLGQGATAANILVGGSTIGTVKHDSGGSTQRSMVTFIVPDGVVYRVNTGSLSIEKWWELR